jgi:hypothetical protein
MEVSGQRHAPAASSLGKELPVGGMEEQSRSGRGGEEKKSHPLPVIEPRSSNP